MYTWKVVKRETHEASHENANTQKGQRKLLVMEIGQLKLGRNHQISKTILTFILNKLFSRQTPTKASGNFHVFGPSTAC